MKKLAVILALFTQSVFVFADNGKETKVIRPRTDNVKVYVQPGTSAEVVQSMKSTEEVTYVRKFNKAWSIVLVNGKPGYMLTSELVSETVAAPIAAAKMK